MFKSEGRVRQLFRKYGKTALATHLTVYGVTFAGIAAACVGCIACLVEPVSLMPTCRPVFRHREQTWTPEPIDQIWAPLRYAPMHSSPTGTCLTAWKLHADQQVQEDANPKERGWFSNLLTGPSSSIALAFLCNKALLPVRAPVTIGLTPMVARYSMLLPTACAQAQSHAILLVMPKYEQIPVSNMYV